MRLAFDATPAYAAPTGIGVFVNELLTRFATCAELDVVAFALSFDKQRLTEVVPEGVATTNRRMPARTLRRLWLRAPYPPIEHFTGPVDVVHGPNYVVPPARSAARVVSVHDLTPFRFPQWCTADTQGYPPLIRDAAARGAWIHTDSHFVAREVIEHVDIDPARVVTVPLGPPRVAPLAPGRDAEYGRRLAGGHRYILALGTIEPRKNLPLLVQAFDKVAADDQDLRLVHAGPAGWGVDDLEAALSKASHADRVMRLGWVNDNQRMALVRGAELLAYPSLYEGFGLPPLEAMAAGTPVVASDAGSLPEVLGDAAQLVPASDPDPGALADALRHVLDDDERRAELVEKGRHNVERFSWDATADGLVDLYSRAITAA